MNLTYGDIFDEFCKKFPNAEVDDFRPVAPIHVPEIPNGMAKSIVIWLKDGSRLIYTTKEQEKTDETNY